ncbi:MAG: GntR family transcriptional regulator [Kiritimatiellia bacterium]
MKPAASSYGRIVEELANDIRQGRYDVGSRCPSLSQLMRRFSVSRMTVLRAIDELKRRGLLVGRPGKGLFVTQMARMLGGTLGLISPGLCYAEIFPPICQTLARLVQQDGLKFLLSDVAADDPCARAKQAVALAHRFVSERVLGVFFQPVEHLREAERVNREILSILGAASIPVVLLDSDIVPSPDRSACDLVGINNFDAGRRLARHLVERGVHHIGFVHREYSDFSVRNRFEGIRSVGLDAGVRVTGLELNPADAKAVRRVLTSHPTIDAIICRNDNQAAHLLVSLRNLGLRVPDDLAVAGFNDMAYAATIGPSLTTIRIPCEDIAQLAYDLLRTRLASPGLPPRECYLSAELVVRESTQRQPKSSR